MLGALLAAAPGYVDFRSLTGPDVKRIGRWHMGINLSIVVLFAVDLWLRMGSEPGATYPLILSLIIAMLGVSGWLGELVYVQGIAVEPQAKVSPETERRGHVA